MQHKQKQWLQPHFLRQEVFAKIVETLAAQQRQD
jgi:hypothetical protein